MARTTDRKRNAATASSGVALVAVLMASPVLAAAVPDRTAGQTPPSESSARSTGYEKQMSPTRAYGPFKFKSEFKHKGEFSVAGVKGDRVVFEDERGNLFYVDDVTGDQKFVSREIYMKADRNEAAKTARYWVKLSGKVAILGIDRSGKTIMRNAGGDKFYLDAATGDMIFVK